MYIIFYYRSMDVDEQDQEDEQEMLEGAVGGAAAGSGAVGGALVPKKRFEVKKVSFA